MPAYRVDDTTIDVENPEEQTRLTDLHARGQRLQCTCVTPPLEMYLAKTTAGVIPKRMPGTGPLHAPTCDSYEPPLAMSGLAPLMGTAILEDPITGVTQLRLAFSMSRQPGAQPPPPSPGEPADTIKGPRTKLTMRGLLHYLWEQAQLTHWQPRWDGKRSWGAVRTQLLDAAGGKTAASGPLSARLYIPEPFRSEQKAEIALRRSKRFAELGPKYANSRDAMMILIGELKNITTSLSGFQLWIKHAPDFPFALSSDLKKKLDKRFGHEFDMRDQNPNRHLIVAATFSVNDGDYAHIDEITIMVVNSNWLPIEAASDEALIASLTDAKRTFYRVLRYALPQATPIPTAIATDTQPAPVGLYIIPARADDAYFDALDDLTRQTTYPAWFWQPHLDPVITLPAPRGYTSMPVPRPPAAERNA
jgi:hypothetical protein